ncbi:MAG: MBL fold metallo-hydrolase [Halioglobus sp.]|nr:MBL fold metallo-hydrolase [Halioglobus sp.]
MKKPVMILIVAAVIGVILYTQRASIAMRVMAVGAKSAMTENVIDNLEDGLHIALCGAGGPLPDPKRSGACIAVVAGKQLFIVDAGTNGLRNLVRMRYPAGDIEAVLLTHFHSDHIDGLGEMATIRWVNGANTKPLPVIGPQGVQKIVKGFNMAYQQDSIYRNEHHGDAVAPLSGFGMVARPFPVPTAGELETVYEEGDVRIQALLVDHDPVKPAVGYLFNYKDRSVLISGDTDKSANIEKFAQGVDLLIHEALAPNLVGVMHDTATEAGAAGIAKITLDILNYHASPVEAAETARDAGVGHLLFYHIVPPLILPGMEAAYLEGVEDVYPDFTLGEDGTAFSLPAGSEDIILTSKGM